jgi:hypothetical protein
MAAMLLYTALTKVHIFGILFRDPTKSGAPPTPTNLSPMLIKQMSEIDRYRVKMVSKEITFIRNALLKKANWFIS